MPHLVHVLTHNCMHKLYHTICLGKVVCENKTKQTGFEPKCNTDNFNLLCFLLLQTKRKSNWKLKMNLMQQTTAQLRKKTRTTPRCSDVKRVASSSGTSFCLWTTRTHAVTRVCWIIIGCYQKYKKKCFVYCTELIVIIMFFWNVRWIFLLHFRLLSATAHIIPGFGCLLLGLTNFSCGVLKVVDRKICQNCSCCFVLAL